MTEQFIDGGVHDQEAADASGSMQAMLKTVSTHAAHAPDEQEQSGSSLLGHVFASSTKAGTIDGRQQILVRIGYAIINFLHHKSCTSW